jgi:hypothetical protein
MIIGPQMTYGEFACHTAQVARQSWPSTRIPPPGALAANEVRGRVIWLNPSITCRASAVSVDGEHNQPPRSRATA